MAEEEGSRQKEKGSWRRLLMVVAGIVFGQFVIYGPSLIGAKILLPLDCLAEKDFYLPRTPEVKAIVPHDMTYTDLVLQFEPDRRFAAEELHAGRFPFWAPYQYAGVPVVWPKYSPFLLFGCLTLSPVILAWAQLLQALVAGLGAYCFFRRALGTSFWAAAIPAWCYPLTGFFVYWQGFPTCMAAYWLPWVLLGVTLTILRPSARSMAGLSAATGLTLVSGHIDVAGQVLLISGLYAIWCWLDCHWRAWRSPAAFRALLCVTAGWGFGFMLGAPQLLPILEYAKTGARMVKRSTGVEERPPGHLSALGTAAMARAFAPADAREAAVRMLDLDLAYKAGTVAAEWLGIFLPDEGGCRQAGSVTFKAGSPVEGAPAGYAGLVAMLFVAPMAWCDRRRRSSNLFWSALTVFGFAWCLGLPGIISILRLPGMNMMSHNRLVFGSSLAILAMASCGLDVLRQGGWPQRRWFGVPMFLLVGLCAACIWRAILGPNEIENIIEPAVRSGGSVLWVRSMADVAVLRHWFMVVDIAGAIAAGCGVAGWMLAASRSTWPRWLFGALGVVMLADMLWFAHDRNAQCDPSLYYPRIPVLEEVARSVGDGRVIGNRCFPAQLPQVYHLNDVRGYDSIDPGRMIDVLMLAAVPNVETLPYAAVEWLQPRVTGSVEAPGQARLSPILDLLGVRYVIFRGDPVVNKAKPLIQGDDYYALVNPAALPRVFIPQRVEAIADSGERLAKIGAEDFDPRQVAYVETPVSLAGPARGTAEIVSQAPTRLKVAVHMETPGLLVLADQWDVGWRATLNGQPAPILRADHALCGVVLPAGEGVVELRYASRTVFLGFVLAGAAAVILAGAWVAARRKSE